MADDRGRSCDRCGRDIHDLEPATTLAFGGGVQSDTLVVCHDCVGPVIEWWEEGAGD